jgi:hypothetical protein
MTTARSIVTKALQKNGVLTKNETPSADEADDGLEALNDLIGSWSNESLLIYARLSESFPLVSGTASYTIGSGGDFNTTRPLQILSAFTRIGGTDYNMAIINGVEYDKIIQKSITSADPEVLYYDGNSALGTITLYPVPSTGTLHIRSEKQLTEFTTLDTDLSLPPGWDRALIYSLAIEQAPDYGQPVTPELVALASDSLGKIKKAVARNKDMRMFSYNGGGNNIYSGWFT